MARRNPHNFTSAAAAVKRLGFNGKLLETLRGMTGEAGRLMVSDNVCRGLRAIIRPSGEISFHCHYHIGESRPFLTLGHYPAMSIETARQLTKTVHALADRGIDPQEGLRERLIRELLERGEAWRPV